MLFATMMPIRATAPARTLRSHFQHSLRLDKILSQRQKRWTATSTPATSKVAVSDTGAAATTTTKTATITTTTAKKIASATATSLASPIVTALPTKPPQLPSSTLGKPAASTSGASGTSGARAVAAPTSFWHRLGPLTRLTHAYGRAGRNHPYITQLCSTLVIYLLGDLSAQYVSGDDEYDPRRTARSLVIGGFAAIPVYKWFLHLSTLFPHPVLAISIAKKVVLNQLLFVPVFNTYFFGMQALLYGHSLGQTVEHVKRTVPTSFVNSCKVWPAITAVNLAVVPMEYRSLFAGGVAVVWQGYLAVLNRRAEVEEAAGEEVALMETKRVSGLVVEEGL